MNEYISTYVLSYINTCFDTLKVLRFQFNKAIGRILNGCEKGSQNITSSYGHHEKILHFVNVIFSSDDHNYE